MLSTKTPVATKFGLEGIKYNELSDEEKENAEDQELVEFDAVLPPELNKFLFDEHTAELIFSPLLNKNDHGGIHVECGDVIGKKINFVANNDHAEFLQNVFDKNYSKWKGHLSQVITYKNRYAMITFLAVRQDGRTIHVLIYTETVALRKAKDALGCLLS